MKIRRKYNNWIPKILRVGAITLYPFILYKRSKADLQTTPDYLKAVFKHEYIHIEQVRRMGWFKFYFLYLIESAKNGYRDNKYEVEAGLEAQKVENERIDAVTDIQAGVTKEEFSQRLQVADAQLKERKLDIEEKRINLDSAIRLSQSQQTRNN